jgi:hypothetical protein
MSEDAVLYARVNLPQGREVATLLGAGQCTASIGCCGTTPH